MKYEKLNDCCLCNSKKIEVVDPEIDMCKCNDCGYFFVNPMPDRKSIQEYYSRCDNFDSWLALEKEFDLLSLRRLNIVRKYASKGKLLDI